jgi:ABC-type Co2+ transport system permease subunit
MTAFMAMMALVVLMAMMTMNRRMVRRMELLMAFLFVVVAMATLRYPAKWPTDG